MLNKQLYIFLNDTKITINNNDDFIADFDILFRRKTI